MAQEKGERLHFFFLAQLYDDFHKKSLANVGSCRNAAIHNVFND
jgi:hypothetical protein